MALGRARHFGAGIGQINLLVGTSIATAKPARQLGFIMPTGFINCPWGLSAWRFRRFLPGIGAPFGQGRDGAREWHSRYGRLGGRWLTLPAAVGLAVLAGPIVSLLFERGAFGATDSAITAQLIIVFSFGLPAFVFGQGVTAFLFCTPRHARAAD